MKLLLAAMIGLGAGWLSRTAYEPSHVSDRRANSVHTDPRGDRSEQNPIHVEPVSSHSNRNVAAQIRGCTHELDDLRDEVARLNQELGVCQGSRVAWPAGLDAKWSADEFQDRITELLARMGAEGDIAFYCDDFPCLAHLPDSTDWKTLQELAREDFGDADTATIVARSHGIVGQYGRRNLRFISIGPADYVDDFARERLEDRLADLIQTVQKDMRLKSEEESSQN